MPKLIITGRTNCGKSFLKKAIEGQVNIEIIESSSRTFLSTYKEGDKIIVIDAPAILCSIRSGLAFSVADQKREDDILSYVTELPSCTIIKNAGSLDDLRVKIKKLIKTI